MKPVNKDQLLDSLEEKVERHLQEAIKHFQNMSDRKLLLPAPDGGWSIAQCLDHLNSYGHFYLPHIKNGLAKPQAKPAPDTFTSSWFGSYFTRIMDPATGKKKYKALKGHIPSRDLDAHAVVAEFIQQQEALLDYLKQARSKDLKAIKIPLSLTKWVKLRLGDVFQFLIAHNERHMVQAKRHLLQEELI